MMRYMPIPKRVLRKIQKGAKGDALLVAVLLAAFALRVFRLGYQPLWSDEIYSVAVARHSLSGVWAWIYRDNHPALYWFVLHPVVHLLGDVELLVRFPSALMGTLTVALAYTTGRQMFGSREVGLLAALWLTVSPFHVVYSQEARMYAPLALFGLASTLFLFRGAAWGGVSNWVLFGVTAAATAHSHNYGLLLVAAQSLWGLVLLLRKREGRLIGGSALSAVVFVALYAPMIPALMAQMRMPVGSTGVPSLRDVVDFMKAFGSGFAGFSTPGLTPGHLINGTAIPSAVVTLTLALLGLAVGCRYERGGDSPLTRTASWGPYLLGVSVSFPVLFVYAYSRLTHAALWQVRGFQMVLGTFALLVGAGLWAVPDRQVRGVLCVGLVAIAALNLHPHYFDRYKSTVPDAVAALESRLGAEDILFVAPYWQWTPFRYYYRGPTDALGGWARGEVFHLAGVGADYADLIDSRSLDVQSEVDQPIVPLSEFAPDRYARVWTIGHQATPERILEIFGNDVTVMHYDIEPRQWRAVVRPIASSEPEPPPTAQSSSLYWDNGIQLLGYRWQEAPTVGQEARLTLFWLTDQPQTRRSLLRLRLLDEGGELALAHSCPMISLMHSIPMTSLGIRSDYPTTAWSTQSIVTQHVEFRIPPDLPPLSYGVEVQLLDWRSGEALTIDGDIRGTLGEISVVRPTHPLSPRMVEAEHRRDVSFGGQIKLLGYSLPEAAPRPGHHLPVWVHWVAETSPSAAYEVHLRLLDDNGTTLTELVGLPAGTSFPTSLWERGDLAQGRFDIHLPPDMEGGRYKLAARLVDSKTGESLLGKRPWSLRSQEWIVIGRAEVLSWPLMTEVPDLQRPVDGQFGPAIHLLGYDLMGEATPGGELSITLYWRAEASPGASYHVFVHLVDGMDKLVAQADGIPAGWLRPTSTWRPGEVIVDEHNLSLPLQLPQDAYHLYVGLYAPEAHRLSVVSRGEVVPDGRLPLASLEVEGGE